MQTAIFRGAGAFPPPETLRVHDCSLASCNRLRFNPPSQNHIIPCQNSHLRLHFQKNFVWGAAAASYQIEGAAYEDGKGLSTWDMLCRQPGRIWHDHNGDVACDHYHRYKEDVALMKEMGLHAYRLSVSWPRVIPNGTGTVNAKGLEFYDKLVDELLGAGIEPWVTPLFHWDLPYELFCRGHWLNPDISHWFADYTRVLVDRLSDRVSNWMTLNEPQCFIGLGMQSGTHGPGLKLGVHEILRSAHNTLLSHGRAVQVLRAHAKQKPFIGWAPVGAVAFPATDSPADIEAARKVMFTAKRDGVFVWNTTWWADPVVFGKYPEDGLEGFGKAAPAYTEEEMKIISTPIDFYGVNIYTGDRIRAGANGEPEQVQNPPGSPATAIKWSVEPESLYWGPRFLYERYKLPVIITENGLSGADWVGLDGKCHDAHRIDFLRRYLLEYGRAIADGVDARGYFQWSIMDNFEWAEGYKERFGLIHVDYSTQKRTPKDSAHLGTRVLSAFPRSEPGCRRVVSGPDRKLSLPCPYVGALSADSVPDSGEVRRAKPRQQGQHGWIARWRVRAGFRASGGWHLPRIWFRASSR